MSRPADINLLSTEKVSLRTQNRILILRVLSVSFLFFVALFSIALFILSSQISPEAVRNIQGQTLQKISLLSERNAKYSLLSDRLRIIKTLLGARKNYTQTLNSVLDQVPQNVNIRGLKIDKDGISVTVSSNSLLLINEFLDNLSTNLDKKIIKDMTIEGLTVDKQTGIFSLSIKAKAV